MISSADQVIKIATGEIEEPLTKDGKNAAAVVLGRKGGQARAQSISAEQRRKIALKAAKARWQKRRQVQ